jgi:hypothetical protein
MSCDACSTRLSKSACANDKCKWISSDSEEGVCVANEADENNIECWMLSKPVCDKYLDESTYITGLDVSDAPCFFNGPDDGWDYSCVTQTSLTGGNCTNIETNSIINNDGKERKSCVDAPGLLGWSFTCSWLFNENKSKYFCTTVYFLTENSLFKFSFLIFFFIFYYY